MTVATTAENLQQFKIRFSLILEQILANMVKEVKDLSPNFKQSAR